MDTWHRKSLGQGAGMYMKLRALNELRYQLCRAALAPYKLVIDSLSIETVVFFGPGSHELAVAFGALPCSEPMIDGRVLIDLEYQPIPLTDSVAEIFQPTPYRRAMTDSVIHDNCQRRPA